MNKATNYLLIAIVMLGAVRSVDAQPPPGPTGPPVFASEPTPPPEAQFCPPNQSVQRTSTVPFDNLCPTGNAFSTAVGPDVNNPAWYIGIGGMALRPLQLGKGTIAVQSQTSLDTGVLPLGDAEELLNYQDLKTQFAGGIRGTVGFNFGPNALEISGYYILPQTTSFTSSLQGQNDVNFGLFSPVPTGFGGNNNIWLQADQVTVSRRWQVANLEANYRYCYTKGIEFIGGFRYFDFQDRVSIFTDDDVLLRSGVPNPKLQADYVSQTRTRLTAFQLGMELEKVLVPIVSAGLVSKFGVGPNFATFEQTLTRGDGFSGPGGSGNTVLGSGLVEVTPYLYFYFNDYFRFRLGYDVLWLVNIPSAQDQINWNPNIPVTESKNGGNQLMHGPVFEFQVAF